MGLDFTGSGGTSLQNIAKNFQRVNTFSDSRSRGAFWNLTRIRGGLHYRVRACRDPCRRLLVQVTFPSNTTPNYHIGGNFYCAQPSVNPNISATDSAVFVIPFDSPTSSLVRSVA